MPPGTVSSVTCPGRTSDACGLFVREGNAGRKMAKAAAIIPPLSTVDPTERGMPSGQSPTEKPSAQRDDDGRGDPGVM